MKEKPQLSMPRFLKGKESKRSFSANVAYMESKNKGIEIDIIQDQTCAD